MDGTVSTYPPHTAYLGTVLNYVEGGEQTLKGISSQPVHDQLFHVSLRSGVETVRSIGDLIQFWLVLDFHITG